jgi:hypothetical protein
VRTPSHGLICASSTARNGPGLCRPRQRRLVDDRRQAAEAELHDAADEVGAGSQTAVAESAPGLELAARNHAADLLVIGSSRRGQVGQILAGVALGLLPGAPCSVALPPPGYAREPRRLGLIGAAHDGSAESREALEVAAGWPRSAMRGSTSWRSRATSIWTSARADHGSSPRPRRGARGNRSHRSPDRARDSAGVRRRGARRRAACWPSGPSLDPLVLGVTAARPRRAARLGVLAARARRTLPLLVVRRP